MSAGLRRIRRKRRNDAEGENHIEAMVLLALDSEVVAIRAWMVMVESKTKECL